MISFYRVRPETRQEYQNALKLFTQIRESGNLKVYNVANMDQGIGDFIHHAFDSSGR